MTINIPITTLPVGSHTFGPTSVASGITSVVLDIDQTAGNHSLNAALPSTTLDGITEISFDGGTTWQLLFHAHAIGGTYTDDEQGSPTFGQTFTRFTTTIHLPQPTTQASQVRARLVVTGAQLSVSGTLTVT